MEEFDNNKKKSNILLVVAILVSLQLVIIIVVSIIMATKDTNREMEQMQRLETMLENERKLDEADDTDTAYIDER